MKKALVRFVVATLITATTVESIAQSALEQARILFDAGAQAFAAGRYKEAVESFKEAYALSGKPQAVFSLAQAERRLYLVSNDPQHLHSAIGHFRKYLELVPDGGRRNDAVEGLEQLQVFAAREAKPVEPTETAPDVALGRILISSATPGARIVIDGTKEGSSPLVEVVSPGKHLVRVSAPGYLPEERDIIAVEKIMVPLEITLREEPAYLTLTTAEGALIRIDGRTIGEAPVAKKVELKPGSHSVVVSLPGHYSRQETIDLQAGKTNTLDINLDKSRQRILSYALLGFAGAGFVGASFQGVVVVQQQQAARTILQQTENGNISATELDEYNASIVTSETLRTSATITVVAASLLGIAGALIYAIEPRSTADSKPRNNVGVSLVLGPSNAGFGISGQF
jgi:tetratricopeptide (TPR) repeat protein